MTDEQSELIRIEEQMRALSPTTDEWWRLRPRRNELRDAIDPEWRAERRFGTRPDASLDEWPDDIDARWRVLRAFIEDERGVRVGDNTRAITASVDEWSALVDQIGDDWQFVFRDAISLTTIGKRFSLMVSGENDYHWTVATADRSKTDPPVVGYAMNFETGNWKLVRRAADAQSTYGSLPSVTDFLRRMLLVYRRQWQPHPRLRVEAEIAERTRIRTALASPIPRGRVTYHPPVGEPIVDDAFAEILARVHDGRAEYWTAPARLVNQSRFSLELVREGDGFRIAIDRAGVLEAEQPDQPDVRVMTSAQAEMAIRHFAALGEHTPELRWRSRRR